VTYNRRPLYTLIEDTEHDQSRGAGVGAYGAEWYAISAAGAKVEKDEATNSGSDEAAPGGFGYGP
jgi:Secreted repeat of unknown function